MAAISQLPSGLFRVQVRKAHFYKAGSFSTKAEAVEAGKAWDEQARQAKNGGNTQPAKGTTVADMVEKYRLDSGATYGRTKAIALERIEKDLGHVELRDLNLAILRRWIDDRLKTSKGISVGIQLSAFSSMLHWLKFSRGIAIDHRMAIDARAEMSHRPNVQMQSHRRDRLPKAEELKAMWGEWDASIRLKTPMTLLTKILMASGLRVSELCRLRVEDFDATTRSVLVRARKDPKNKAARNEHVPLVNGSWELLAPLLKGKKTGLVFPNVKSTQVSQAFTTTARKLGYAGLSLHSLRHHAVTTLFNQGLDVVHVSLVSGHRSLSQLRRYGHPKAEDVHARLAVLNGHAAKPSKSRKKT